MNEWMVDALMRAGFDIDLKLLPSYDYRIVLIRRGQKCLDIVRGSRRAAIRAAYYLLIEPEQDLLERLTLAERTEVLRVRQEIAQA